MTTDDRKANLGRKARGRVVYSHGPIIKTLITVSAVSSLFGAVAVVLSVLSLSSQVDTIQRSRRLSATDTCYVLRKLVIDAYPRNTHLGEAVLLEAGLGDCISYGYKIRNLK